jgi:DMSO/TMAO reductase YedYZ molybdopterin-dependent catalytic subunit
MMPGVSWLMTLLLVCSVSVFAQQSAPESDFVLTVGGEVEKPLKLSVSDLSKFPRRSVQAKDHDGKEHRYDGIELQEILRQAGVKQGKELRGKALALFLLVEAADNYQAVFALPELDPEYTDRVILLVDKQDGQPLPSTQGPFRLIVPGEKIFTRWVRQVKSLTILRAAK